MHDGLTRVAQLLGLAAEQIMHDQITPMPSVCGGQLHEPALSGSVTAQL